MTIEGVNLGFILIVGSRVILGPFRFIEAMLGDIYGLMFGYFLS